MKKIERAVPVRIVFPDNDILRSLFGEQDKNVKLIEKLEAVKLGVRGNVISVTGTEPSVNLIRNLFTQLYEITGKGYPIYPVDIEYAHRILSEDCTADLKHIFLDTVFLLEEKDHYTKEHLPETLHRCDQELGYGLRDRTSGNG